MKGLEPSTFCMARTKREMTGVDWNDRLRLLHRSRESEPTRDVSNRQPHLAENLARMKPMPLTTLRATELRPSRPLGHSTSST
jgi:hypothetical protein